MTTQNQTPPQHDTKASLVGGVALGLLIAVMGSMFVVFLVRGYSRAIETREWDPVPMKITNVEIFERRVGDGPKEYKPIVEYAFVYKDRASTSEGIKRTDGFTKHMSKAQRVIRRYPVGKEGTCWVNPQDPTQTVLKHNTKAVLYTVWFPGLFVIAGLGIAVGSIRAYIRG